MPPDDRNLTKFFVLQAGIGMLGGLCASGAMLATDTGGIGSLVTSGSGDALSAVVFIIAGMTLMAPISIATALGTLAYERRDGS